MMTRSRQVDVLVVGAGPAGSAAAIRTAEAGLRTAIVDRAPFPRDKACGDLVGSRGVKYLRSRGFDVDSYPGYDNTVVVGPDGRRVTLPLPPGRDRPEGARVIPRYQLDAALHSYAAAAGAEPVAARATESLHDETGRLVGFGLTNGDEIRADCIVGADGASSVVARAARLVDPNRVLWGFAVRSYLAAEIEEPLIVLWSPDKGGYPGFGWIFPGLNGLANVGLGVGTQSSKSGSRRVTAQFDAFLSFCADLGLLPGSARRAERVAGSWLKMGMVGTVPARDNVLLAGEAAGLTNPLTGEGISHAILSGDLVGQLVGAEPKTAAERYQRQLVTDFVPFQAVAAAVQKLIVARPRASAVAARMLTRPLVGKALGPSWSLYWNDLSHDAAPSPARTAALLAQHAGDLLTSRTAIREWFANAGLVSG